ncbi:hypothetical protein TNCV_1889531 [Trichonephila clavipes]|nr:hypothetical protein TNCV_1889531 [Trichonephila clavipes]
MTKQKFASTLSLVPRWSVTGLALHFPIRLFKTSERDFLTPLHFISIHCTLPPQAGSQTPLILSEKSSV